MTMDIFVTVMMVLQGSIVVQVNVISKTEITINNFQFYKIFVQMFVLVFLCVILQLMHADHQADLILYVKMMGIAFRINRIKDGNVCVNKIFTGKIVKLVSIIFCSL